MSENLFHFSWLAVAFLALFGLAELAYHFFKIQGESTRKLVHIGTGLLTLFFPLVFDELLWVVLLCLSFLTLLLLSQKFNFLKSINDIDRKSFGSILYPIIVIIIFTFFLYQRDNTLEEHFRYGLTGYFYLPILVMALADPVAALVGKNYPWLPYQSRKQNKTISGSLGFFVVALILSLAFLKSDQMLLIFSIAFSATLVEAVSKNGFDNFSIPLCVAINLYFL